jgi:hypothetical protein
VSKVFGTEMTKYFAFLQYTKMPLSVNNDPTGPNAIKYFTNVGNELECGFLDGLSSLF